jgi:hypothetical protein
MNNAAWCLLGVMIGLLLSLVWFWFCYIRKSKGGTRKEG